MGSIRDREVAWSASVFIVIVESELHVHVYMAISHPSMLNLVSGDFGPRLFRTGDFGRQSVISDGDFGRCAVNSDAAVNSDFNFGRCAVNFDAQLSSLLYHYFGTNIAIFGW